MMPIYFASAFISLFFVGLRSWQQLNVVHKKYLWIPPTSYLMAFCEVFLIGWVAGTQTWEGRSFLALFTGTGGWIGCMLSTWLHGKLETKGALR